MNKSYALIWNQALGCWNVASEGTRRRSKSGRGTVVIAAGISLLGLLGQSTAFALPEGGKIVAGDGGIQISNDGKNMVIDQRSDKLIANWNAFSVGQDERVSFQQPGQSAIALNRVIGNNGSDIQGRIDANGKVFLINPNGVVFGKTAQVNVGGLVASTRDIADKDFLEGNYHFSGNSTAAVSNAGNLTASEGGSIALLGAQVSNSGVIRAQMGSVALGAGKDFTVNFDGDGLLNLQVDASAVDALAYNGGLIKADGGSVLMTASSADSLLRTVVSNEGVIEAQTLQNKSGKIVLDGGSRGIVRVAGTQDASAVAGGLGDGGLVENRGANVEVQYNAQVDTRAEKGKTGTWKIRSNNVVVAKAENPPAPDKSRGLIINGGISGNTGKGGGNGVNVGIGIGKPGKNGVGVIIGGGNSSNAVVAKAENPPAPDKSRGLIINGGIEGNTGTGGENGVDVGIGIGKPGENGVGVIIGGGNTVNGKSDTDTTAGPTLHADTLARNLATTHIELTGTQGDVKVEAPVAWNSGNTLSLSAENGSVLVNGDLKASGDQAGLKLNARDGIQLNADVALTGRGASLELNHHSGYSIKAGKSVTLSGSGAEFRANGQDYKVVQSLKQLSEIADDMNGRYVLGAAIVGQGSFTTIGDGKAFSGKLDGLGNTISNLDIYSTGSTVGLFGVNKGEIGNLNLERVSASGAASRGFDTQVGTLVGQNEGVIRNVHAKDVQVTGARNNNALGGLVGTNLGGTIANSSASGTVVGDGKTYAMGGLAGQNLSSSQGAGAIANSSADVSFLGQMSRNGYGTGGLVGYNKGGVVSNSSSTGAIRLFGNQLALGGLVGQNHEGAIANSSSSTDVTGGKNSNLGGLVGVNRYGTIANSQASGRVIGNGADSVGGLVGNNLGGTITNSSANGTVSDANGSSLGGLVGQSQNGLMTNVSTSGYVAGGSKASVGGLVGYSRNTSITNASSSTASISGGADAHVGGLVGYSWNSAIANASSSNFVAGGNGSHVGGLVGTLQGGRINNASAGGSISGGNNARAGGLVGMNNGEITNANASGRVSGGQKAQLGGLVGQNRGWIQQSSAGGHVEGYPGQIYGGLVGMDYTPRRQQLNSTYGDAASIPMTGSKYLPF
ncbi:two-partner secretion domain-containing protein [Pseudomonas sp. Q1-7]|uniref:two-partner secretion domain-containing protein n=1 Tax=Pseudomonas sp. Q1-7 TaxID=3020843 RepID=UPI0023004C53|nr:GLUG motif-containing protein [Pseudomonas sp. Q1-7]